MLALGSAARPCHTPVMRTWSTIACLLTLLIASTTAAAYTPTADLSALPTPVAISKTASGPKILAPYALGEIFLCKPLARLEKSLYLLGCTSTIGETGYQKDEETGLYYAQQRYYDSFTGRFLREDPFDGSIDTPPSLHRYLYAYANPTIYVDRDGRTPRDDIALRAREPANIQRIRRQRLVERSGGPENVAYQGAYVQVVVEGYVETAKLAADVVGASIESRVGNPALFGSTQRLYDRGAAIVDYLSNNPLDTARGQVTDTLEQIDKLRDQGRTVEAAALKGRLHAGAVFALGGAVAPGAIVRIAKIGKPDARVLSESSARVGMDSQKLDDVAGLRRDPNGQLRDAKGQFAADPNAPPKPAAVSTDSPGKPGPKTDPNAPHNKKIREVGDRIVDEGGEIIAGGGRKPERLVPTVGGDKDGRRPDVLYKDCDGVRRGCNVGQTTADGKPVPREQEALDDLTEFGGLPATFEPYDL